MNKRKSMKIAASFDLSKPYVPGGQNFDGIPNASPEMLRRLKNRKMKNPGGQLHPTCQKQNVKSGDLKMSLYENIHKKRARIAAGSGERMRDALDKRGSDRSQLQACR